VLATVAVTVGWRVAVLDAVTAELVVGDTDGVAVTGVADDVGEGASVVAVGG
jgi:hypothetical protein